MSIVWSPEAVADVEAAVDYLAERNPAAALKLVQNVMALVERLASEPHDGPEHRLSNGERVRGWPYPPFRIYYQRGGAGAFFVVRVYHQRRVPIAR